MWPFTLLKRKPSPPKVNHSEHDGDMMTEYELEYVTEAAKHPLGPQCPDCRTGTFMEGPRGVKTQDFMCRNCHAEFCFFFCVNPLSGYRVGERGCPSYHRIEFYEQENS